MDRGSFLKLPEEKRDAILRIAAEEFIRCGYAAASTNTITRRAGISKGILFHYFGSKKELYLHLFSDMTGRLLRGTERQSEDVAGESIYDRMAALFHSKAAYFNAWPLDMSFMERAGQEMSDEVRPEIVRVLTEIAGVMRRRRVEETERALGQYRLREGVTRKQALECIMLSIEALDARFYALYRGKGAAVMQDPSPILDTMKMFLGVVCKGLFED